MDDKSVYEQTGFFDQDIESYDDIDVAQNARRLLNMDVLYKPLVILLTDKYDYESDVIGQILAEREIPYVRLNSSYIPHEISIQQSIVDGKSETIITSKNQKFSLSSVKVIFERNFQIYDSLSSSDVSDKISFQEWDATLSCIKNLKTIREINACKHVSALKNPMNQLLKAAKAGFKVPDTYLQFNSSFELDKKKRYIYKSIGHHHIITGKKFFCYYSKILNDFKDVSDTPHPMLIQEKINFEYDLRVTFVGSNLFFSSIKRNKISNAIDYKEIGLEELETAEIEPDAELLKKVQVLINEFELDYGSIDFLVTKGGDCFFLEVNDRPDWKWLNHPKENLFYESLVDLISKNIEHDV